MPPHRPQQGEEAVCFLPPGSASLGNAHRSPPGVLLREALGRHKLTAQCGLLSRRMGFLCFGPRLRLDAARHSGSAGSVGSHRPPWVEVLGSWLCTAQMPKPWACEVRERPSCHAQSAGPEPLVYTAPWPPRSEILSTGEAQALVGKGDLGGGGTLTFPPTSSRVLGHWARSAADRTQEQGPGLPPRPSHGPMCGFHGATEPGWPERKEGWEGKGRSLWLGWAVQIDPEGSHGPALPIQSGHCPAWGLGPVLGQLSVERWLLGGRAGGLGGNVT